MRIASQHRVQPLLHARIERGEIDVTVPDAVREKLQTAHRDSALSALSHRTELFWTVDLLRSAGFETIALKGAWLSWYAYPAAAERPVRDIDLLLKPDEALPAFQLLRANGFVQADLSALPAEHMASSAKHLPPLTSPAGVEFEVHMHAWEPPGSTEWPMPKLMDDRIFADAEPGDPADPCRYPKPYHMLIHMVVHAAYSHRFDVGPLVLSDIGFLLSKHSIDWHNFWRDAHDGGFAEGAALVLHLVDRWINNGQISWRGAPPLPNEDLLKDCEQLLMQDLAKRKDVGAAAAIMEARSKGGMAALVERIKRRASGENRGTHSPDGNSGETYPAWLLRRIRDFTSSMTDTETRAAASCKARVGRHLSGGH